MGGRGRKRLGSVYEALISSANIFFGEAMIKTFEEHKVIQSSINDWRCKVGALDTKGWYPYKSEVDTKSKGNEPKPQLPQDRKVTTQFKRAG